MAGTALYAQLLSSPVAPQNDSPLFSVLPAEVRGAIYAYALTDYPDPSPDKHYEATTCYTRPSYFAPRKNDTQLLQTCRAVYQECWFMPFVLKEQTHWLTVGDRAPPEYNASRNLRRLARTLRQITEQQGQERVEIDRLRVFAQMWKLEAGDLADLLSTPYLHPRSLTLTIRHADWWFWENDDPLRFEGKWIRRVCEAMSPSVREFRIELESLVRKKDQIDLIAKQMIDRWFFKRSDDVVLYADIEGGSWEESRWSGTSKWHNQRWIRDETEPGRIDYYVLTITFRVQSAIERRGGKISETARHFAEHDIYKDSELKLHLPDHKNMVCHQPFIFEQSLGADGEAWDSDAWEDDEDEGTTGFLMFD
ncbi:hypothetical protein QQX98_004574 [Neonectria punicea]|uniref:Uncharacterized protein n=1 Tax=Neonectria punicea TaxID=979145 RepID=A0ABR1H990_9HYPO